MLTIVGLVKKDGTYFLYYIGADGDRRDGGPAHRRIGVATCPASADITDPANWTKHAGNPVIQHHVRTGRTDTGESGVFSGAVRLAGDGTILIYYGGMEEYSTGSVDGDIVLATSADGFNFGGLDASGKHGTDVWTNEQSGITTGDELYPVAVYAEDDGITHIYYVEFSDTYDLWVASGPTHDHITSDRKIQTTKSWRKVSTVWKEDQSSLYHTAMIIAGLRDHDSEWRIIPDPSDPASMSEVKSTYDGASIGEGGQDQHIYYLDHETATWVHVYLPYPGQDELRIRTAPAR